MKSLITGLLLLICFSNGSLARVDITSSKAVYKDVTLIIWNDYLREGKELPVSWKEIPTLKEMVADQSVRHADAFKVLNSMAIVPGAPIIFAEPGVSTIFSGRRLFAIAKKWDFENSKPGLSSDPLDGGRNAILITADGSDVISNWIPEGQARLILKRLNDFKPEEQPPEFKSIDGISQIDAANGKGRVANVASPGTSIGEEHHSVWKWILFLVALIAVIAFLKFRSK